MDLDLLKKAAEVALMKKLAGPLPTVGLPLSHIPAHVDIMRHLAEQAGSASSAHLNDLAHYYTNLSHAPQAVAGQHALEAAAQKARSVVAPAATQVASKMTPTQAVPQRAMMQHLAKVEGPAKAIQSGVQYGAPVLGTADVLSQLERTSFDKLATEVGVVAGKMKEHLTPENLTAYGLPSVFGALSGAENVPRNPLLGAVMGGGGAVGGNRLGSHIGKTMAQNAGMGPVGVTIADLIGQLIGSGVGTNVGVRSARLLAG